MDARMRTFLVSCVVFSILCAAFLDGEWIRAEDSKPPAVPEVVSTTERNRKAVERGLAFLQADAVKWRKEKNCSTCHHGTMTVWALNAARSAGYSVDGESLADTTKWTKDRLLASIDKPRDPLPGPRMMSTPAVYLALMAQAVPSQESVSADDLKRIADHLVRYQEPDGSWAWSSAPPKNRPPPFFESDEVATLLVQLALAPRAGDANSNSPAREAREKAAAWLAKVEPSDSTQAAAFRLLVRVRAGESATAIQPEMDRFLRRQREDGGWGQLSDRPSDAYATGQALHALSIAGIKNDSEVVVRGVAFLVGSQKEDGSWPMSRRGHPGVTPSDYTVPITYFGSAWGTLGLIRSVPK
jgi:hypothetical protein